MSRRITQVARLNRDYQKLAHRGGQMKSIYRQMVGKEYYAMLSQFTYELEPKAIRSNRLGNNPIVTDVSAHKGKLTNGKPNL